MAEYTPMMQNYLETKKDYQDCILFYRLGDFYEMFFDDAITASREIELTLTGKDCGKEERAPMCGVPYHAVETYIAKLVEKGYKVAICEQLEDPKQAKGIVKRGVVRVVTPGTVIESNLLEEKKNNYIMSIYKTGIYFGIAVCDVSTGDFLSTEIQDTHNFARLLDEIARYSPAEIITNDLLYNCKEEIDKIKERFNIFISCIKEEEFIGDKNKIKEEYQLVNEEGKRIDKIGDLSINAISGLLSYLQETQKMKLDHIYKIEIYSILKYMSLDINARRNLEITEKMRDKSKKGTLLWVLDKTATSMGGRQLRRWINNPLIDEKDINRRLDATQELKDNIILRGEIIDNLKKVYDMERLAGKIAYGNANGRDLISLKNSVNQLPGIKQLLKNTKCEMLQNLYNELDELQDIYELIDKSIIDDPPISITEGGIIKNGYSQELDLLKKATIDGKTWLVELEAREKRETGIKGLKVGFNKVFGYYLEVTKANIPLVPDRYIRKQTLTNGERYVTEELKNMENQLLGAEEKSMNSQK